MQREIKSCAHPWNNPDAGSCPLPECPLEITASIRAAEHCMELFPYLRIRFGGRGETFSRTDSGFLTTLAQFPKDYVIEQVQWLARILSNRGMPRWLMEVHLEVLAKELAIAIPSRGTDYGKLLEAAAVLRRERRSIVTQATFDTLADEFELQSGNYIVNFGGLVVSAVCDEANGIKAAVSSITQWMNNNKLPPDWQYTVTNLCKQARQIAYLSTAKYEPNYSSD